VGMIAPRSIVAAGGSGRDVDAGAVDHRGSIL
jgi:hypothetical protein